MNAVKKALEYFYKKIGLKVTDEQTLIYEFAMNELENQESNVWIPVEERMPNIDGAYLITYLDNKKQLKVYVDHYDVVNNDFISTNVVAWMELPKAYTQF